MRRSPVLRSLLSLASLFAVTVALVLLPTTAASAAGEEADFTNRLNASRASVGLAPLNVVGELATSARAHSQRMGQENRLYHNPALTTEVTNWQSVGENVGYGPSVAQIYDALYASAGHRDNMLSSTYTEVGIGTWTAPTGRLWVTQVFRKPLATGFPVSPALAATVAAFAGTLGAPVGVPYSVLGGVAQDFRGGDVLWGPSTDARVVQGSIRDRYRALAGPRSVLGLPATHELPTPDRFGRYNHFQGGSIYWSPTTGAREVHGSIRARWAGMGWELGRLGYPTSDEYAVPGGRRSDFQHGSIVWTAATAATIIV